ncbi:uncharacterized protein VTP21DRAFT_7127 [Calcarisporiella thermophila]|uniref:uncharacterized protein n=1 Tax=Calcarisporiella thermophila TaxID=911321 RepID=UPI0037449515
MELPIFPHDSKSGATAEYSQGQTSLWSNDAWSEYVLSTPSTPKESTVKSSSNDTSNGSHADDLHSWDTSMAYLLDDDNGDAFVSREQTHLPPTSNELNLDSIMFDESFMDTLKNFQDLPSSQPTSFTEVGSNYILVPEYPNGSPLKTSQLLYSHHQNPSHTRTEEGLSESVQRNLLDGFEQFGLDRNQFAGQSHLPSTTTSDSPAYLSSSFLDTLGSLPNISSTSDIIVPAGNDGCNSAECDMGAAMRQYAADLKPVSECLQRLSDMHFKVDGLPSDQFLSDNSSTHLTTQPLDAAYDTPSSMQELSPADSKREEPFASSLAGLSPARDGAALSMPLLKEIVRYYLASPNPGEIGEKCILIATPKVAQKSYGTEKRFLTPPPTTLLLGPSWNRSLENDGQAGQSSQPRLTVSITGEVIQQQGSLEWFTKAGTKAKPGVSSSEPTLLGQCVSKQLHINDADEKRRKVEVVVRADAEESHLGDFASKPIKVISKPSKKRQSLKNMDLCIHHGSTISLFNRLRSQTVSTKYLGSSRDSQKLPTYWPWSSGESEKHQQDEQISFVSRSDSWDAYIIWLVDLSKNSPDQAQSCFSNGQMSQLHENLSTCDSNPSVPAHISRPPLAYRPAKGNHNPIPIHYNQPVVLQCLATGKVSPIMVIRKVDKGNWVVGGGAAHSEDVQMEGDGITQLGGLGGEEAIGDPVSQLQKVAFEIRDPSFNHGDFNQPGEYLACLPEGVSCIHAVPGSRKTLQVSPPSRKPSPTSEGSGAGRPASEPRNGDDANSKTSRRRRTAPIPIGRPSNNAPPQHSGSLSSSPASGKLLSKNRQRVNSTSGVEANLHRLESMIEMSQNSQQPLATSDAPLEGWTEDITDAAVWTIVGTDSAFFKFFAPHSNVSGNTSPLSQLLSPLAIPVTPIPVVMQLLTTSSEQLSAFQQHPSANNSGHSLANSEEHEGRRITVYGKNFTPGLSVWFGEVPSVQTEQRCSDVMTCWVPPEVENLKWKVPVLLVRNDGVIYKTEKMWPL